MLVLLYVFLYVIISLKIFGACVVYNFRCLFFCIVDVTHVECGYILNLLYSQVEFNFQD